MAASVRPQPDASTTRWSTQLQQRASSIGPPALTKPEVHRISEAAAALRPSEDEKKNLYLKQHEEMNTAFVKARGFRRGRQAEYDRRFQHVADKLREIRNKTNAEATKQLARIKETSTEFDERLAKAKHDWQVDLSKQRDGIGVQRDGVSAALDDLQRILIEEIEACRSEVIASSDPLLAELKERQVVLGQQTAARVEWMAGFEKKRIAEFSRLRKRLSRESCSRTSQCTEGHAQLEASCRDLLERLNTQDASEQAWEDDLRAKLEKETVEQAKAPKALKKHLATFMAGLEAHISASAQSHSDVHAHLATLKRWLRSDDPS